MPLLDIFIVLLLVAANGFFVAVEFSLVAVRPTRIAQLREQGEPRARTVQGLLQNLDRVLSGVQVGITIASLSLGWLGEITVAGMVEPLIIRLGLPLSTVFAHTAGIVVAFALITALHVVLGELIPKSIALERAERVALIVARPMTVFQAVFGPFISLFDRTSILVLRMMGVPPAKGHSLIRSPEEFQVLLKQARDHGVLTAQQARMLDGALELATMQVREVMVPRDKMVGLPAGASLEETLAAVREHSRSRYPVYEDSMEQVIGSVHAKDLFKHLEDRVNRSRRRAPVLPFDLRRFLRPALFVPETRPLAELLEDLRRRRAHLAIVVDEFGSVQGMVTLADVVEPIVGEVADEYESETHSARAVGAGQVFDAGTSLHDLEHQHQIDLPPGRGFETLAGFVLNRLGYIPSGGESFLHDGLRLTVIELDDRRISRVKIEKVST